MLLTMRGEFDTASYAFFEEQGGAGLQPVAHASPVTGVSGVKRSRGDMEAAATGDDQAIEGASGSGGCSGGEGGGCPPAAKRRATGVAVDNFEATGETAEV